MRALGSSSAALAAVTVAAIGLPGCGGGDGSKSGAKVADLQVPSASFASHQSLAKPENLRISIHNPGSKTLRRVTIAIQPGDPRSTGSGFYNNTGGTGSSDPRRPIWIVNSQPPNGPTADPAVWQFGPLGAGRTITAVWNVTPVQAGNFSIRWTVGGDLAGKVRIENGHGDPLTGKFKVNVSSSTGSAVSR